MRIHIRPAAWQTVGAIYLLLVLVGAILLFTETERAKASVLPSETPCLAGDNLLFLPTLFQSSAPSSMESELRFFTAPTIPLPDNNGYYLRTADFNQDGLTDLAAFRYNKAFIVWNLGNWRFSEPSEILQGVNRDKELIADMNGDGYPDLVVVVDDTPNRIDVLYGECSAALSAPETVFVSSPQSLIYDLTTGDVNNDGRVDLILERYEGYAVALAKAEGGFESPQSRGLPDPIGGTYNLVADFNGDDFADIVIWDYTDPKATVYYGSVTGDFSAGPILDWSAHVNDSASEIRAGDFNRDGRDDLVVTASDGDNSALLVYAAQTARQFAPPLVLPSSEPYYWLWVADLNQDGFPDLLAQGADYRTATFLGDGAGTFGDPSYTTYHEEATLDATANYGGDAAPDLLLSTDRELILLPNSGQGTFLRDVISTARRPLPAVGDVDGDGRADIMTANRKSVSVLLGLGQGNFAPPRSYAVGEEVLGMAVGQLNQDAFADVAINLATNDRDSDTLVVFHANGAGELVEAQRLQTPDDLGSIAIAHMNGDAWPDLVFERCDIWYDIYEIHVYLGGADGRFSPGNSYPARNCPNDLAVTDLNLDGHTDVIYTYQTVAGSPLAEDGMGLYYGDGQGNLLNHTHYARGGDYLRSLTVGNINGDSRPDVAVTSVGNNIDIYLGNGAGGLDLNTRFKADPGYAENLHLADLTGNGLSDLVNSGLFVYPNQGGSYSTFQHWPAVTYGQITSADMNGDGRLDLIVGNTGNVGFDERLWLLLSE